MTIIDNILDRLILILGTVSSLAAGTIDKEYPEGNITDPLPLTVVTDGDATYEKIDADTWRVRRAFTIEIFYSAVTVADRRGGNARQVARGLTVDIPTLIANRPRLDYNGAGLNNVIRVEIEADDGIGFASWGNSTYVGTLFTVFVTYDQMINYGG